MRYYKLLKWQIAIGITFIGIIIDIIFFIYQSQFVVLIVLKNVLIVLKNIVKFLVSLDLWISKTLMPISFN